MQRRGFCEQEIQLVPVFFHSCFQSFHLNSKPSTKPRRKQESHPNRDMILLQLLHHKECNIKFSAMAFVGFVQIVAAKPRQKAVCIRINDRQRNSQWGRAQILRQSIIPWSPPYIIQVLKNIWKHCRVFLMMGHCQYSSFCLFLLDGYHFWYDSISEATGWKMNKLITPFHWEDYDD